MRKRDEKGLACFLLWVCSDFPLAVRVEGQWLLGSHYCLPTPSTPSCLCWVDTAAPIPERQLSLPSGASRWCSQYRDVDSFRPSASCQHCGWVSPGHRPSACHHWSSEQLARQPTRSPGRAVGLLCAACASAHSLPGSWPLVALYPMPA